MEEWVKDQVFKLNLTGGDGQTKFRVSSGYDYDRDIITESGVNYRGSFSLSLNHKSADQRFGLSWSALYSLSKVDATNRTGSVLLPPNAPSVFDEFGHLNYEGWEPLLKESYLENGIWLMENHDDSVIVVKKYARLASRTFNFLEKVGAIATSGYKQKCKENLQKVEAYTNRPAL